MYQNSPVTQGDLQKTFIAFLFAFAISVVAQQLAELLVVITSNWKFVLTPAETGADNGTYAWPLSAIFSHSLLALLMLSVSWVMWSRSKAAGHVVDVEVIFSMKFITLLLEILLVTLYFSLAKSAEGDFAAYSKEKTIASYITSSSSRPESMQMLAIFAMFAVWDYFVDVEMSPQTPAPAGVFRGVWSRVTGILTYCSVSLACALGAAVLYAAAPHIQQPAQAFWGDVGLIALLLLFNQGKPLEHYLFKVFPSEASRVTTKRIPTLAGNLRIVLLLILYGFSLIAAANLCGPK